MTSKNSRKREISVEFQNDNFSRLFAIFSSIPASMHTPSPFYILYPPIQLSASNEVADNWNKNKKAIQQFAFCMAFLAFDWFWPIRFKLELHFEADTKFARFGDIGLNSGYTVSVFFRWYTFVKQILRIAKNLHMIVRFI